VGWGPSQGLWADDDCSVGPLFIPVPLLCRVVLFLGLILYNSVCCLSNSFLVFAKNFIVRMRYRLFHGSFVVHKSPLGYTASPPRIDRKRPRTDSLPLHLACGAQSRRTVLPNREPLHDDIVSSKRLLGAVRRVGLGADGAAEAKGKACLAPTTRAGRRRARHALPLQRGQDARDTAPCPYNAGRMPATRRLAPTTRAGCPRHGALPLQRGQDARATGAVRIPSRRPRVPGQESVLTGSRQAPYYDVDSDANEDAAVGTGGG